MKNKLINVFCIFLIFVLMFSILNKIEATDKVLTAMNSLKDPAADDTSVSKSLGPIINTAIGFIQITGTGVAVIMVTMLGIKYMLSAPSEKADVKKQITPLLIGAIILFASVNIIQIIADFAVTLPAGG